MLTTLHSIDVQLLLFINGLHNSVLDFIMYWVSNRWVWIPLYLFLFFFLRKNYPERFYFLLIFVAIMITLTDQLSSGIIKNLVMRPRPCHNPEFAPMIHLVNGYCGGPYGFVSSHAANGFGLLTFLTFLFRRKFRRLKVG